MQPNRPRPYAYWCKPWKHHTTMFPSAAFPLRLTASTHGFAACEYLHLSVISLEFASQDHASFLGVMMTHHWATACRRCQITEESHLQGLIFFLLHHAHWFALRWEVGTRYRNYLTHCGRVTQICVFNTVKLGTSASSPYCHSTRGNVSRGITPSSTTRVFGEYFLKISVHKDS